MMNILNPGGRMDPATSQRLVQEYSSQAGTHVQTSDRKLSVAAQKSFLSLKIRLIPLNSWRVSLSATQSITLFMASFSSP